MSTDPRYLANSGREIFTGNELLIKGALETEGGVHLLTGYPGSPVAGFFDIMGDISDLLKTKGIRAFQANNGCCSCKWQPDGTVPGDRRLQKRRHACGFGCIGIGQHGRLPPRGRRGGHQR